jgi:hypothetical protein
VLGAVLIVLALFVVGPVAIFFGGGSAFALPEGTFYTTYDLVEGRTVALCFVPVGLTMDALESGEDPEGARHFTEGMVHEFEVTS